MRIEVDVTQEDIDEGRPFSCWDCPVARALERALGYAVEVDGTEWTRRHFSEFALPGEMHSLPVSAQAFIGGFDLGATMTPFKFTIEVNE